MKKSDKLILEFFPPSYWEGWYIEDLFAPQFSSEWDMLMPIVEDLEKEFSDRISININGDQCHIRVDNYDKLSLGITKIDAVYQAIIELITFFNTHNIKYTNHDS